MVEKDILEIIENLNCTNRDITVRRLTVYGINIYILFIMQITDKTCISEDIIRPILSYNAECPLSTDIIGSSIIYTDNVFIEKDKERILEFILHGNTVILIPGDNDFLRVNTLKIEKRNVDSPELETALRAPRDAFTENLDTNLSLIRYRIKDPALTIEKFSLGKRTKTEVAVVFLKDVANQGFVNDIKNRLSNISIDGILEIGRAHV